MYDIYFFFENNWKFNEEIIEKQTGKNARAYLQEVLKFIERYSNEKNILDRLGELVDDKKRQWVKKSLKKEVIKKLAIQIEAMRE